MTMQTKPVTLTTETDHLVRFLDAISSTPITCDEFTRTCIEHKMHQTESRRAFVRSLYGQIIEGGR